MSTEVVGKVRRLCYRGFKVRRHCAFCMKLRPAKLCHGCNRRAYCSARCRDEDQKRSGDGQSHGDFCHIEHGQQDLEWEVRRLPGKGSGVFAMRHLPAGYKIMIEQGYGTTEYCHPATPSGASLYDKFASSYAFPPQDDISWVNSKLRFITRMNHSCAANAYIIYYSATGAFIVYASEDIKSGQEIRVDRCIELNGEVPLEDSTRQSPPLRYLFDCAARARNQIDTCINSLQQMAKMRPSSRNH